MKQAVGVKTGKVYAEGELKLDVLRELNRIYPYQRPKDMCPDMEGNTLPETVKIVRRNRNERVRRVFRKIQVE